MPGDLIAELKDRRRIVISPFFQQAPDNPRYRPGDPGLFAFVAARIYTLDLTPGQTNNVGEKIDGSIKAGAPAAPPAPNAPVHLFKWLPFVAGSITYTAVDRQFPILTGNMTGCWLSTFQLRGQTWLAHIGTDSNSVATTLDVKNAWTIATRNLLTKPAARPGPPAAPPTLGISPPFQAFQPSKHVNGMVTFGAMTTQGAFYAVACDNLPGNTHVVKQVRQVTNLNPGPMFT